MKKDGYAPRLDRPEDHIEARGHTIRADRDFSAAYWAASSHSLLNDDETL
jgi:hypothetical protein